jgi:hypothetical protein
MLADDSQVLEVTWGGFNCEEEFISLEGCAISAGETPSAPEEASWDAETGAAVRVEGNVTGRSCEEPGVNARRPLLPLPLLLVVELPLEADDDEDASDRQASGMSLLLFPVALFELMLLALTSERPGALEQSTFFTADEMPAFAPFSFAADESLAFFCCSQDWRSSSRDRALFLGCIWKQTCKDFSLSWLVRLKRYQLNCCCCSSLLLLLPLPPLLLLLLAAAAAAAAGNSNLVCSCSCARTASSNYSMTATLRFRIYFFLVVES